MVVIIGLLPVVILVRMINDDVIPIQHLLVLLNAEKQVSDMDKANDLLLLPPPPLIGRRIK